MSKKVVSTICICILVICCAICSIGYAVINSSFPWWLFVFAGGIICAIASMIVDITNEKDKTKRSKRFIGCICTSICMVSVFIFLAVMMLTNIQYSWIIVCVGGVASFVTYKIYDAVKNKKK